VPDDIVVNYRQGISPDYLQRFFATTPVDHEKIAALIGDTRGRSILLSFGRAAWYKGLDLACNVAAEVAERGLMYPVICAADYGTPDSQRVIESLRHTFGLEDDRGRILTDFPFDLPKQVMRHPDLRVVLVPSRRENLSAIPSEARILTAGSAVVVASAVGGLTEQVEHGADGFLFDPEKPSSAAEICTDISAAPRSCLESIAFAARRRVMSDYVLGRNLARSVRSTLGDCEDVSRNMRNELHLAP
jgi:glycosyltransferase involved in cell wall biosynthesis